MTRSKHYVDAGQDAPDPGSAMNQRILAALNEAVSRSDSARRSLDAVEAVLRERADRSKGTRAPLDRTAKVVAGKHAVPRAADGTRRRHARPLSEARADEHATESHENAPTGVGHERSTCDHDDQPDTAQEVA